MSNRYKFFDNNSWYFVTFSVVEWVDVFTRNEYRKIVVDSIKYCIENKGLIVFSWVIMTNHVHLLVSVNADSNNTLSDIMRDLKKFTSMHLIKVIRENGRESRREWMLEIFLRAGKRNINNTNFQFWQQDNHPIAVKDAEQLSRAIAYIHDNPVKQGFATEASAFPWSSAVDYSGGKGLIDVILL